MQEFQVYLDLKVLLWVLEPAHIYTGAVRPEHSDVMMFCYRGIPV